MDCATIPASAQSDPEFSDTTALETTAEPSGAGGVEGVVYDANMGLGIPDACVHLTLGEDAYETYAGTEGFFCIEGIPGCAYEGLFSGT